MLAGCPPVTGIKAAEAAAATLLDLVPQVIVTLGGDGLVLASRKRATLQVPGHAVVVENTHGAGDALIGALAARLADGTPLPEAARNTNAAAATIVATPENARGDLTRKATQSFLAMRATQG